MGVGRASTALMGVGDGATTALVGVGRASTALMGVGGGG